MSPSIKVSGVGLLFLCVAAVATSTSSVARWRNLVRTDVHEPAPRVLSVDEQFELDMLAYLALMSQSSAERCTWAGARSEDVPVVDATVCGPVALGEASSHAATGDLNGVCRLVVETRL
ncbi:MAG: hypothetical protein ABW106_14405 [Steroidobacteraceae bacterium]